MALLLFPHIKALVMNSFTLSTSTKRPFLPQTIAAEPIIALNQSGSMPAETLVTEHIIALRAVSVD